MPIIKSAKKRVRTANKAAVRNAKTKRTLKSALKAFVKKPSSDAHASVQSNLDKAAKKGILHKNKVARLKKQTAAKAKASGVKPATAKKTTAAKPAAKKTTPKKAVVKKAPAKKPAAAKKAPAKKK